MNKKNRRLYSSFEEDSTTDRYQLVDNIEIDLKKYDEMRFPTCRKRAVLRIYRAFWRNLMSLSPLPNLLITPWSRALLEKPPVVRLL
jgi:hypothetical protein